MEENQITEEELLRQFNLFNEKTIVFTQFRNNKHIG